MPNAKSPRTIRQLLAEVLGLDADRDLGGFALMTATIMLGILLAVTAVLLDSAINSRKVGNVFEQALSAEQIAEAGIHKALYCTSQTSGTNCGGTYGTSYTGESNVTVGTGKFTTTVTGDTITRTVTSVGTSATGQTKTVKSDITDLAATTSLVMAAAVQAGAGGANLANNVTVTGDQDNNNTEADSDIQSVGDVLCGSNKNTLVSGNIAVTRVGGKVDSCKVTKNAYADNVTTSNVTGDAYYAADPSGINGTTVGGTKHPNSPTPSPTPFPNLNVSYWEGIAAAGGTNNGTVNITTDTSLGPIKIVGDLNLTANSGKTLTLNGPVYVTGNINLGNNCIIKLASNFASTSSVLIADGSITVSNNGDFQGSGTTGSVLIVVSNSTNSTDNSPAIYVKNNVTLGVLYAPYGEVHVSNNANVPAEIGATVVMDNGTTVNTNGLNVFNAPVNLASTGATGSWHIKTNSWREFK